MPNGSINPGEYVEWESETVLSCRFASALGALYHHKLINNKFPGFPTASILSSGEKTETERLDSSVVCRNRRENKLCKKSTYTFHHTTLLSFLVLITHFAIKKNIYSHSAKTNEFSKEVKTQAKVKYTHICTHTHTSKMSNQKLYKQPTSFSLYCSHIIKHWNIYETMYKTTTFINTWALHHFAVSFHVYCMRDEETR